MNVRSVTWHQLYPSITSWWALDISERPFVWLKWAAISCPNVYPAPRGDIPQPQRSSGSDHKRSHIGPSCGTYIAQAQFFTCQARYPVNLYSVVFDIQKWNFIWPNDETSKEQILNSWFTKKKDKFSYHALRGISLTRACFA